MKKIYFLFFLLAAAFSSQSQWTNNTSTNTLVANKDASDIQTANTNDGRTWIAFYSQRGANYDMRAQLLNANGSKVFGDTGILVSNKKSGSATFVFNVCVDKDNNFIIAYQIAKGSAYECIMQKINTSGQLLWTANGVDLGGGLAPYPTTLSTNEIAVAWNDNSGKIDYQKVSADGIAAWASPKVFTGSGTHSVSRAQLVAGTNGNFSMVYQDQFSAPFYTHLFAQKFDNNGIAVWATPVQISTLTTVSYRYFDVINEKDTTYVGYYGNPSNSNRFNAYVQRINADGSLPWGVNGGIFSNLTGANDPYEQTIYIAKKPGSYYMWAVCTVTNSLQTESGVFVQEYSLAGNTFFGGTGKQVLPVSANLYSLAFSQLSLCDDNPVFLVTGSNNKLAAVKLDNGGNIAWKNKATILGASANTKFRYGFTNFYKGQAVAVWQEDKGDGNKPYAQNIRCDGSTGPVATGFDEPVIATNSLSIKRIYPNPVVNTLMAIVNSSVQGKAKIYITDVNGNVLKQTEQNMQKGDNNIQLNVSTIKPGSYFIKVTSESGNASTLFNK